MFKLAVDSPKSPYLAANSQATFGSHPLLFTILVEPCILSLRTRMETLVQLGKDRVKRRQTTTMGTLEIFDVLLSQGVRVHDDSDSSFPKIQKIGHYNVDFLCMWTYCLDLIGSTFGMPSFCVSITPSGRNTGGLKRGSRMSRGKGFLKHGSSPSLVQDLGHSDTANMIHFRDESAVVATP